MAAEPLVASSTSARVEANEAVAASAQSNIVQSKAVFHGYCIWIIPPPGSECARICHETQEKFSKWPVFYPPLQCPRWQPHICVAAGIDDKNAALKCAKSLTEQFQNLEFDIDLSGGAEVDLELDRKTIYFSWQRLRAAWIHATVLEEQDDDKKEDEDKKKENILSQLCRRAYQLLGEDTQTERYVPHLSLVYFDKDELTQEQRLSVKQDLHNSFPGGPSTTLHVDRIYVSHTEGLTHNWKILAEFPFAAKDQQE